MKNIFIILVLSISFLYCQDVEWAKTYHNDIDPGGWDIGYNVFQTDDGGLLIIGIVQGEYYRFFIIKTDSLGNEISKNMYCDSTAGIFAVSEIGEDTIAIFQPLYVLWINEEGDSIFANPIPRTSYPIQPVGGAATITDEGYIFFCTVQDSGGPVVLYKISLTGEILSMREYYIFGEHFEGSVVPCFISQTEDGGFIIGGAKTTSSPTWVIKLNEDYEIVWEAYPPMSSGITSIIETEENEFLCLGGATYADIYVCKIVGVGELEWWRFWDFDASESSIGMPFSSLISTFDGNYVFCGLTGAHTWGDTCSDGFIMKIDSLSLEIWKNRVDVAGRTDIFFDVIQTSDSGYVCTGYASVNSGLYEYPESLEVCLVKFSPDGDIVWENNVKFPDDISLSVFPNPFNSSTKLCYLIPGNEKINISIDIYDISGKLVRNLYTGSKGPGNHYTMWNGKDTNGNPVNTGIYLYKLQYGKREIMGKIMLVK